MSFIVQPGVTAEDLAGGATSVSSAISITLTPTSTRVQNIAMTASGQSVTLPDASDPNIAQGGPLFIFKNTGLNVFALRDASAGLLATIAPGQTFNCFLIDNTTVAGIWRVDGEQEFAAAAAGTIANVATVILTASGTVEAITATGSAQGVGSATNFTTGTINYRPVACYDPTTQQVIVFFADPANSNYSTAVVGTVSGTSISFGSKYVVNSNNSGANGRLQVAYDTVNSKVLFLYVGAAVFLRARVGTVSGTALSFGTELGVVASAANEIALAFNPSSSNFVYADYDTSAYGYTILGVLTISGTNVSANTPVGVTGNPTNLRNNLAHEPVSGKLIYTAYRSNNIYSAVLSVSGTTITQNTYYSVSATNVDVLSMTNAGNNTFAMVYNDFIAGTVKALAATIAGTVITYGTAITLQSISINGAGSAWDTTNSRVVFAWDGYMREGTISGTTFTLNSSLTVSGTAYMSLAFMPNVARTVNAYRGSSNMEALTYKVDTLSTNLTANNFVGFADNAATVGNFVAVKSTGDLITGLSGLTPASKYYVQSNGTLATTADPVIGAVYAGIAVSTTTLLMN